jgi:hypothetical protein
MLFQDAQEKVALFLSPLPLDRFLDQWLFAGFARLDGAAESRAALLGPDPRARLLDAWEAAPTLTYHSANPTGPPPPLQQVSGRAAFAECIELFHARNYSVRFPDVRGVDPAIESLARAFEVVLHQPVSASVFWSRGGMRAPVHHDDHDLLVVQLRGTKRWLVSTVPSELPNAWRDKPSFSPGLGPHESFDLHRGEAVYLPRGTLHSVDGREESLHVALGFTPLTVRDAIVAALDHLSDLERPLRTTLLARAPRGLPAETVPRPVADGAARLLAACHTPGFLDAALHRRSRRIITALRPLPPGVPAVVALDSMVRQRETAFCHLSGNAERIEFSYPGGQIFIHRGAEESVVYISRTSLFRVRDIPGEIDDEVRISLVERLMQIGFLEMVTPN